MDLTRFRNSASRVEGNVFVFPACTVTISTSKISVEYQKNGRKTLKKIKFDPLDWKLKGVYSYTIPVYLPSMLEAILERSNDVDRMSNLMQYPFYADLATLGDKWAEMMKTQLEVKGNLSETAFYTDYGKPREHHSVLAKTLLEGWARSGVERTEESLQDWILHHREIKF